MRYNKEQYIAVINNIRICFGFEEIKLGSVFHTPVGKFKCVQKPTSAGVGAWGFVDLQDNSYHFADITKKDK